MDRYGKQRLIGAVVLVALAVVVIPELLSGPKRDTPAAAVTPQFPPGAPEPVRNVTVDLASSTPSLLAGNAAQAPVPPAENASTVTSPAPTAAAPMPTVASATATVTSPAPIAASPAPTAASPTATVAASATPTGAAGVIAPAAASAATSFAVQLGSFVNRGNADKLLHQLKALGYAVNESSEGAGNSARYRVRIGPLSDRDSAERTMSKLKSQGYDSTLIAPR